MHMGKSCTHAKIYIENEMNNKNYRSCKSHADSCSLEETNSSSSVDSSLYLIFCFCLVERLFLGAMASMLRKYMNT